MNIQAIRTVDGSEETVLQTDNCTINLNLGVTQSEAQAMIDFLININKTDMYQAAYPSSVTLHNTFSDYYKHAPRLLSMICHDKIEGSVPMTFSESRNLIGACEANIAYSGDNTKRGTYNTKESKVIALENGYNVHLVYDFPTHAGNGAIKRICFYPTLLYTDNYTERGNYYYPSIVNQLALTTKINKPIFTYPSNDFQSTPYYSFTSLGLATVGNNGEIVAKTIDKKILVYYNPTTGKITTNDFSSVDSTSNLYQNYISYFDDEFWYPSTYGYYNVNGGTSGNITMYNLEFDENGICKKGSKTKVFDDLSVKTGYKYNRICTIVECPTCYTVVIGCNSSTSTSPSKVVLLFYNKEWEYVSSTKVTGEYSYAIATSHYYDESTRELYLSINGGNQNCMHCIIDESFNLIENGTYKVDDIFTQSPNGDYMASFKWSSLHTTSSNNYQHPYCMGLDGIIGYSEFKKPVIDIVLEEPLNKTNAETLKLIFDFEILSE